MGCQLYVKENSPTALITNQTHNRSAQRRARHQVHLPNSSATFFPDHSRPSSQIPGRQPSLHNIPQRLQYKVGQATSINVLPDDVLLSIFDFCADQGQFFKPLIEAWQSLVHVCRRWRSLVFGSSRGLNLQLACSTNTPARDTLDVWPSLPLLIECALLRPTEEAVDNIIAVLERRDRVCRIRLGDVPSSHLDNVLAAMREPFPELTALRFRVKGKGSVVPDSFLGGSAPRLQELLLNNFSFPGLPRLLLSATNLGTLHLSKIPHSGYISPEAMATALSTLTSLRELLLNFKSPQSYPDRASRRQPPPTLLVLPVLTTFWFTGVSEYLDDLMARISRDIAHCGGLMHRIRLASVVSGTSHYIVLASPSHAGGPLHLQGRLLRHTKLARQHRELAMAGVIAAVYCCEESSPVRGICATRRSCLAGARWGKNDRSVAHSAEFVLGGAPAAGTSSGKHGWKVHFRAAGHQSPYNSSLGQLDTEQGPRDQHRVLLTFRFVYLPGKFPLHSFHGI